MAFDVENPIGSGTDAELLVLVRAAIVSVTMHGQEYVIRGRTFRRADLAELRALEASLQSRVSASSASSGSRDNFATRQRAV